MKLKELKIRNLKSPTSGREVANQFEVKIKNISIFYSYNSLIAVREGDKILVSPDWCYSATTLKYFKEWLYNQMTTYYDLTKRDIEKAIKKGGRIQNFKIIEVENLKDYEIF